MIGPDSSSIHSAPADLTPFPGSTGQTSADSDDFNDYLEIPLGKNYHKHGSRTGSREFLGLFRGQDSSASGYYGSMGERNSFLANRSTSITESLANSVVSLTHKTLKEMRRRRFLYISIIGIFFILLFDLIFLPRTSLDRDLRRLHREYLTFDDCTRIFLTDLTFRNGVSRYLHFQGDEIRTPGDNHELTVDLLKEFDFKVSTEKYETWLSKPIDTQLALFSPKGDLVYDANLMETELLSFLPYSASGEVHSRYVFANYGSDDDFQALKEAGVKVAGNIVIVRNGGLHPSLKLKQAELANASAVVLYSDPYDDGKFKSSEGFSEFPQGYAANHHAVNKDTLNGVLQQPGDPTTPGWSSTLFSHRVKPETIPRIPALPISYGAIKPILNSLPQDGVDLGWKGDCANFTYTAGVSEDTLRLRNLVQFKIKPIFNIILEIKGIMKDEEIVVGASRDVIGGIGGTSSGFASLLEMARGFDALAKRGWKPLRTIKLICWDGSTLGQLGSTEFGEFYEKRLKQKAIVYVNLDGVKGSEFSVESNPLYRELLVRSMKKVMVDDDSTLWDKYVAHGGNSSLELISQRVGDYSVFQSYVGVPSINVGFVTGKNDPVPYDNSKFDSLEWVRSFDKDLHYHNMLSQFAGFFVLQLSEKEILNVGTRDYISVIRDRFTDLAKHVPEKWLTRRVMMDPRDNEYDNPTVKQALKRIEDLLELLDVTGMQFDSKLKWLQKAILYDYPWFRLYTKIKIAYQIKSANRKIKALDKLFVPSNIFTNSGVNDEADGLLRGRKWFRHMVFAPDVHTGYNLELLPGLTEALERGDVALLTKNLAALDIALDDVQKKLGK